MWKDSDGRPRHRFPPVGSRLVRGGDGSLTQSKIFLVGALAGDKVREECGEHPFLLWSSDLTSCT